MQANGLTAFGTQLFDAELGFSGNQKAALLFRNIFLKVYGVHKITIKCLRKGNCRWSEIIVQRPCHRLYILVKQRI